MKRIPSFCITLLVVEGIILIYPTAYGSAFLVSTRSVKNLKFNLENYVERMRVNVLKW